MKKIAIATLFVAALAGCMNMPTPTAQITGSYTSGLKYETFECSKLAVESDSLHRRESQLVVAQEQRVKTSQMQAFWRGFGQGDGLEASELANVRGEKEAVRKAMEARRCEGIQPASATISQPPPQQDANCIRGVNGQCISTAPTSKRCSIMADGSCRP